eukprot:3741336-Rhodomonas_salina.1
MYLNGVLSTRPRALGSARPQPCSGLAFKLSAFSLQRPGSRPHQNRPFVPQSAAAFAGAAAVRDCSILFNLKLSAAQQDVVVSQFRKASAASAKASIHCLSLKWSADSYTQTILDLWGIKAVVPMHLWGPILQLPPGLTALEITAGKPLVVDDVAGTAAASLDSMAVAAAFDELVLHAVSAVKTRASYWAAWKCFVSFLYMKDSLLLCCYSGATFDKFYSAIIELHKEWDGFLPIPPAKFRIWVKTVQAQLGIPKKQ